ncbi:MAG: hypothetical protein PWR09_778 [Archaeoglobi archaeon]|nr:winged helix-turn-helix transcriptional regulator [Candidatus Mnemosynella bozhongmuii]MDI3502653.1 hypothetical protein [Archaeoglobi archaeon]
MTRERIIEALGKVGERGILQSELGELLGLSPSTISEILNELEVLKIIVRREIGRKVKKVWLRKMAPFPLENTLRVGILRASEYPHVLLALSEIQNEGIETHLEIFENALDATSAAVSGRIDVVFSPMITQLVFSLVTRRMLIWASCGFNGGGLVLRGERIRRIASSELSTMERVLSTMERMEDAEIKYSRSAEEMIGMLERGEVDAIAIWEPYLSMMKERGYRTVYFSEKFGDYICCTAGVSSEFLEENREIFRKFAKIYKKASEEIEERFQEASMLLSSVLGIPKRIVEESMRNFKFDWRIDRKEIERALRSTGLSVNERRMREILLE